jgi:hypothetical protein
MHPHTYCNSFSPVPDPQLGIEIVKVVIHGPFRNTQGMGDAPCVFSDRDAMQDLLFPFGQPCAGYSTFLDSTQLQVIGCEGQYTFK